VIVFTGSWRRGSFVMAMLCSQLRCPIHFGGVLQVIRGPSWSCRSTWHFYNHRLCSPRQCNNISQYGKWYSSLYSCLQKNISSVSAWSLFCISSLPRQYLVPELSHIWDLTLRQTAELRYEVCRGSTNMLFLNVTFISNAARVHLV
jgi:hypothetical protein